MTNKISFTFTPEKFSDFLVKMKDLASIDPCIKIKIDKEVVMMYALKSEITTMVALKTFAFPTAEYFPFDQDITLDYVISDAPKLIKSLNIFMIGDTITETVKLDMAYSKYGDVMHVQTGLFSSGKLKISCLGSELFKIRDLTYDNLEAHLNPELSQWSFTVGKTDLTNIKKLSAVYSEDKTINIASMDGTIVFSEGTKWELKVGDIEDQEFHKIIFIKKYLSNVDNTKEDVTFFVFDNFILVKDDISNLMISFEQSWDD